VSRIDMGYSLVSGLAVGLVVRLYYSWILYTLSTILSLH